VLANGAYIVELDGTNSTGHQFRQVLVTVSGDYKPGRLVVEATDFRLPLAGMPITIGRKYDSLEKDRIADAGRWRSATRAEVDPAHNVTLTMPGGRRTTFQFAGQPYSFPFSYLYARSSCQSPGCSGR
jgi:hypothetical protein